MSASEFKNLKTQETRQGINFGGPKVYFVGDTLVYAPEGGESISLTGTTLTLNPLGLTSESGGAFYSKISEQIVGDGTWTITVKHSITGEEISGVYEFSSEVYYTTECDTQKVLANCGGYKVEDTWTGQDTTTEWKRLVHTDANLPHEILPYKCPNYHTLTSGVCNPDYEYIALKYYIGWFIYHQDLQNWTFFPHLEKIIMWWDGVTVVQESFYTELPWHWISGGGDIESGETFYQRGSSSGGFGSFGEKFYWPEDFDNFPYDSSYDSDEPLPTPLEMWISGNWDAFSGIISVG